MSTPTISESEWKVMEALWEHAPKTSSELTAILRPTSSWAGNTVRTLLTRLVQKGAVTTAEDDRGVRTFLPAVEREECVRVESESFLQRLFGGAAKPLLVHFAQNSKLTPEEIRELKEILDRSIQS